MDYRQVFDKTLREFQITAKSLSEASGVQERQISHFRNGKELMTETFFKVVEAMPTEAKKYFYTQLRGNSYSNTLESLIEDASDEEIESAMLAIARKWKSRNIDTLCPKGAEILKTSLS